LEKTYTLELLTTLKEEEKHDSWELFTSNMAEKHPEMFVQIKKLMYNEDKYKIIDTILSNIIDYKSFSNFRISRDDNNYSMQKYKRTKIQSKNNNQNINQFDSAIYSTNTQVNYYFGFDY
jgi:hypothetical protein